MPLMVARVAHTFIHVTDRSEASPRRRAQCPPRATTCSPVLRRRRRARRDDEGPLHTARPAYVHDGRRWQRADDELCSAGCSCSEECSGCEWAARAEGKSQELLDGLDFTSGPESIYEDPVCMFEATPCQFSGSYDFRCGACASSPSADRFRFGGDGDVHLERTNTMGSSMTPSTSMRSVSTQAESVGSSQGASELRSPVVVPMTLLAAAFPAAAPRQQRQAAPQPAAPLSRKERRAAAHSGAAQAHGKGGSAEVPRTTLMLRNLPAEISRDQLVGLLDREGFNGRYDFVYLPSDFHTLSPLGFAFVNGVTGEDAQGMKDHFEGFHEWGCPTNRKCSVGWSSVKQQGLRANIGRYRNSSVMHHSVAEAIKPALFCNGRRVAFPTNTRKVLAPFENQGQEAAV